MIQKDYVIRQLSELQQLFAAVLQLKSEKNFEEAYEMVSTALKSLGGIKPQVIAAFNLEEILQMMSGFDPGIASNKERLIAISRLIFEHGNIDAARNKEGASTVFYYKALSLLLHSLNLDKTELPTKEEKKLLKELIEALQGYGLHDTMKSDVDRFLGE